MGRVSKKCKLETESVTFNVLNPRELAMHLHVNQQTNKSGYLKHLVELDMMGVLRFLPTMSDTTVEPIKVRPYQEPEKLLESWMDD